MLGTIGIEWVQKYNGRQLDLTCTKDQAERFSYLLAGIRCFNHGDHAAWDLDFEQYGVGTPPYGDDTKQADSVDIVYFAGHGEPAGPLFGRSNLDDGIARNTEVRLGDQHLKWIVFDACEVLHLDNVFARWGPAFQGLHQMLGFHTRCNDEGYRGAYFAVYLNAGWRVCEAWKKACELTEVASEKWAYLTVCAVGIDTSDDHWVGAGYVSPDPRNPLFLVYRRGSC